MKNPLSVFLTAEWRNLAMLNYDVDSSMLIPFVPAGTELDLFEGRAVVSLVGFMFLKTRVMGIPIPFHRNFEEVNLRFYVRRKVDGGWRRAVVFIKELVPRKAIAATARALYGENYVAVPMSHASEVGRVSYHWRFNAAEYSIRVMFHGEPRVPDPGSEVEFITDHYWGYTNGDDRRTKEYQVARSRWRVWPADEAKFEGAAGGLYGTQFVHALTRPPRTAFLAEGSGVTVFRGVALDPLETGFTR